jgi:hypothetical protein
VDRGPINRARKFGAVGVLVALLGQPAPADDRFYVGPDGGSWNDPANWSATSGGPGGAGVPQPGDRAFLDNATAANSTTNLNVSYSAPGLTLLRLDGTNGFFNGLSQNGSFNMAAAQQRIGVVGRGRYVHAGGLNAVSGQIILGEMPSGIGVYELSGGTLVSPTSAPAPFFTPTVFSMHSRRSSSPAARAASGGTNSAGGRSTREV